MFTTGTQVVVLRSSKKSGSGAKAGSVGFVCNESFKGHIPTFYDHDGRMYLKSTSVFFSRLGYGRKRNPEFKRFIATIPCDIAALTAFSKEQFERYFEERIESFHEINFETPSVIEIKTSSSTIIGSKNIHVGIMAPYKKRYDLLRCRKEDFDAWISSHVMSDSFNHAVMSFIAKHNEFGKAIIDTSILNMLNEMRNDRRYRNKLINKNIMKDRYLRQKIVEAVRKLVMVGLIKEKRKEVDRLLERIEAGGLHKSQGALSACVEGMVDVMFDGNAFENLLDAMMHTYPDSEPLMKVVSNLSVVKDRLWFLSPEGCGGNEV